MVIDLYVTDITFGLLAFYPKRLYGANHAHLVATHAIMNMAIELHGWHVVLCRALEFERRLLSTNDGDAGIIKAAVSVPRVRCDTSARLRRPVQNLATVLGVDVDGCRDVRLSGSELIFEEGTRNKGLSQEWQVHISLDEEPHTGGHRRPSDQAHHDAVFGAEKRHEATCETIDEDEDHREHVDALFHLLYHAHFF